MIFTSYTYLAFLVLAFLLYWMLPVAARKPFLVAASYFFYCTWRWQFGFLLLGVSLFNWSYARYVLTKAQTTTPLVLGVLVNVGLLVYYKYTMFLIGNMAVMVHWFNPGWTAPAFDIILPLGISFFTFQGVAYLFDVATGEEPLDSLLDFLVFKALWPQLIAGPIVRLSEMREQLQSKRSLAYDDIAVACHRIVSGFFKKVVVADNLAPSIDSIFRSQTQPNFVDAVTAVLGFGLQVYCDFSAYSDIAIGSARLFGYRLPENFNWPYTAASPREFWNRWHMTLSRWIRDYLFTPMSFAARSRPKLAPLWLLIAMALCGLWHGAAWTFVLWGIWHGLMLVANQTLLRRLFPVEGQAGQPAWKFVVGTLLTLLLVQCGWLLFRASSLHQAMVLGRSILTLRGHLRPAVLRESDVVNFAIIATGVVIAHAVHALWPGVRARVRQDSRWLQSFITCLRPVGYATMILMVIIFDRDAKAFVYFQF